MIDKFSQELSLLPLSKLNGALLAHGESATLHKIQAVESLWRMHSSGLIGLEDILKAPMFDPVQTPNDDVARLTEAMSNAVSSMEKRFGSLEQSVGRELIDVGDQVLQTNRDLKRTAKELQSRIDTFKQVDHGEIIKQVAAQVSQVFEGFRETVSPEEIKVIASKAPHFRLARAGDVFPVTDYDGVDFSDLEVALWDDPDAPSITDYVFDPAHLHQALVALDDPLPDNVWLAGERGTGKTEFVTQVAARLGRKLFRVNFDEAIERADFIGANTIEDGSVVWKAGVVAQAIQHAGAIVLLDEVGFARAQSISVLHALTERSPHRALMVNETGQKIPVASYVSFFAADNTNGHGDASGNFAGVRDQNTAFLDRFGYTLEFTYLAPLAEANLISSRTNLPHNKAYAIVEFAQVARQKARNGALTQPPSLRQLFALARAVHKGIPLASAFKSTIINKFPADCEPELLGIFSAAIDQSIF